MGVFGHNGCSEIKVYSTLVAKWASHERRLFAVRHTSTVRSNRAGFAVLSGSIRLTRLGCVSLQALLMTSQMETPMPWTGLVADDSVSVRNCKGTWRHTITKPA